ncbi:50S ribosomal protein L28 [Alphaproteobacteria bacterium]|nr:50S ribosomal protein L28 [Alphaproteobacteria bacterium]
MSKVCEISGKKPMSGNNVSHANNRTKRRFIPNLQNVKLYSGTLQKYINLNITVRTMKTVEKNGGLDSYLIKTSNRNLADTAIKIKKQILKNNNK